MRFAKKKNILSIQELILISFFVVVYILLFNIRISLKIVLFHYLYREKNWEEQTRDIKHRTFSLRSIRNLSARVFILFIYKFLFIFEQILFLFTHSNWIHFYLISMTMRRSFKLIFKAWVFSFLFFLYNTIPWKTNLYITWKINIIKNFIMPCLSLSLSYGLIKTFYFSLCSN